MIRRAADDLALFADPRAMPADTLALVGAREGRCLFGSLAWYRTVIDHGLGAGETGCFAVWPPRGPPDAIFPLVRAAHGDLRSLTNPYSCVYAPLLAPRLGDDRIIRAGEALGVLCRGRARVRLDALPAEWPALPPLLEGVRRAGLVVHRFNHFGNWYEPVGGVSWAGYLAARPGALREIMRRKLRRIARGRSVAIEVVTGAEGLGAGIGAFETVYGRSWKEPEPFPAFNPALMRAISPLGSLRLGLMRIDGEPVAAQFWIVEDGRATVLKLAHDERFKAYSPGTVLTASMLRRLLDEERVREIDFGRGDDRYKSAWASRRRQRIGVLLINPRRPRGLIVALGTTLGAGRRAVRSVFARPRAMSQGGS
ncbi:MAG: GNAT family N-acetyltransferase [Acetobacteraceae bacterium]|nr:GNAT family N-acetyltransferase [Acetobacteraceae bacterium]